MVALFIVRCTPGQEESGFLVLVFALTVRYYCRMQYARIQEIFASIQGEGPWIGQRHIFIRFTGCDIACRYCDTPDAQNAGADGTGICRVQKDPASFTREQVSCRFSPEQLTNCCSRLRVSGPGSPFLSLTGGEPLLQHAFLSAWLPQIKNRYSVYLETNGIHAAAMASLRHMIDVVSMDFKLPSATGLKPFWEEHKQFLAAARGMKLFVKAVVTADTSDEDVLKCADLIAQYDRTVPLIIQPARGPFAPDPGLLIRFQNRALGIIGDVRVIPQIHMILNVP